MKVDVTLRDSLERTGEFDAGACLNCGSCTALCPLGLPIVPRRLFRYALLGSREKLVGEADAIFSCLLCKMCEENCPAGVHITDNVRALRSLLDREVFEIAPVEA